MQSFQIHQEDEGFVIGQLGNLGVIIWRETATVNRVGQVLQYFPKLEQQPGQGFGLMVVVTSESGPPSKEARESLDEGMKKAANSILGIAIVIEAEGLLGNLARAVARTMGVINRTPYPVNPFPTIKAAADWMSPILSKNGAPKIDPSTIEREIERNKFR